VHVFDWTVTGFCTWRRVAPASAEVCTLQDVYQPNTLLCLPSLQTPSPAFIVTYAHLHLSSLHTPISIFTTMKFSEALIVCLLVWMFVFLTVTQIDLGNYSLWLQISWLLVYLPLCCGALIISIIWTFAIGLHEHPNGMDRLFRTWLHIPPMVDYGFPW